VRIKTVSGATGSVSGVTYKDITLSGITKYGVVIEQDYENGSPTGTPTTGVPITGLTLSNVHGTVTSSATNIYILCGSGSCSNWVRKYFFAQLFSLPCLLVRSFRRDMLIINRLGALFL
jgi:polygalacturonase